jgi:hypothetical protein
MMSQPSRLSHLGIFFAGVEIYFLIFLVELDSTHRDLSKNDFFEILSNFLARAKFFGPIFCQTSFACLWLRHGGGIHL